MHLDNVAPDSLPGVPRQQTHPKRWKQGGPEGRWKKFVDELKEAGFLYAMRSGLTIGMDALLIPKGKQAIIINPTRETISTS